MTKTIPVNEKPSVKKSKKKKTNHKLLRTDQWFPNIWLVTVFGLGPLVMLQMTWSVSRTRINIRPE